MDKKGGYAFLLDLFPEKDETLPNTFLNDLSILYRKLGVFTVAIR